MACDRDKCTASVGIYLHVLSLFTSASCNKSFCNEYGSRQGQVYFHYIVLVQLLSRASDLKLTIVSITYVEYCLNFTPLHFSCIYVYFNHSLELARSLATSLVNKDCNQTCMYSVLLLSSRP